VLADSRKPLSPRNLDLACHHAALSLFGCSPSRRSIMVAHCSTI
jgi:hypothetical protein